MNLFAVKCTTEADRAKAASLFAVAGIADYMLFSTAGKAWVYAESAGNAPVLPAGERFENSGDMLRRLYADGVRCGLAVVLYMHHANLPEDLLKRHLSLFLASPDDYTMADMNPLTKVRIEFLRQQAVESIVATERSFEYLGSVLNAPAEQYRLASIEDYRYYYGEHFDTFYGEPKLITLQLVDACTKVCGKCHFFAPDSPFVHSYNTRTQMDFSLLEKILREVATYPKKPLICPSHASEPLMYKEFERFMELCVELGLEVSITTNADLLSEKKVAMLSRFKNITDVVISLDAVEEETYRKLQAPGKLAKVEENIRRLFYCRPEGERIRINMNFVEHDENRDEFPVYLERWKDVADYITLLKKADYDTEADIVVRDELECSTPKSYSSVCNVAWDSINIDAFGRVWPCTQPFAVRYPHLGSLAEKSVLEVWRSPAFMEFRTRHLAGEDIPPCIHCNRAGCLMPSYLDSENGVSVEISKFYKRYIMGAKK